MIRNKKGLKSESEDIHVRVRVSKFPLLMRQIPRQNLESAGIPPSIYDVKVSI